MYEIHAFTATAYATSECSGPYRLGDRHPMLAFLRQSPGMDHDWTAAESWINRAGWTNVKFERAATLNPEYVSGKADYLVRSFEKAMHDEFGFVVYEEVLPSDEENE
jgi:hypothetical protein